MVDKFVKLLKVSKSFTISSQLSLWNCYKRVFRILFTLSWRSSLSSGNQSIHLWSKSMDWFLYDRDLRHERVKEIYVLVLVNCWQWTRLCRYSFLTIGLFLYTLKTSRLEVFWCFMGGLERVQCHEMG